MSGLQEARELTAKENITTMRKLVRDWGLGPTVAPRSVRGNGAYTI